jgi:hypothetical protein
LSLSQLQSVVTEVESILNSRPLIYVGSELSGEVLTPAHFLSLNVGDRICGKIWSDETDDPEYLTHVSSAQNLLQSWKKRQRNVDHLWKLWYSDYLLSLRELVESTKKQKRTSVFKPRLNDVCSY